VIAVGIDPGLSGAIAFITHAGGVVIEDLPTVPLPGNGLVKRRIDSRSLADIVRHHVPAGEPVVVRMEQVGAMGGKNNAVQTQVSLGRTLGAIESVLELLRMPPVMVQPQAWKKFYGLGRDKAEAMACARRLYPEVPLRLAKHHNRAEALLIAHHGLRMEA
jgi:hypothetical protein